MRAQSPGMFLQEILKPKKKDMNGIFEWAPFVIGRRLFPRSLLDVRERKSGGIKKRVARKKGNVLASKTQLLEDVDELVEALISVRNSLGNLDPDSDSYDDDLEAIENNIDSVLEPYECDDSGTDD